MIVHTQEGTNQNQWTWFPTLNQLGQGLTKWDNNDTGHDLAKEWRNPHVVIGTVLMLVGGDVIRAAMAQSAGMLYTPVCFSFGWIAYCLSAVVDVFGDGKLLPRPDYPVKVFNLSSGYWRENRNWVIGRIVRDHQTWISREEPLGDNAIRIAVYEAEFNKRGSRSFRYTKLHLFGVCTTTLQLAIASIPTIITGGREWGVLIVTVFGTGLALIMGALPQWTAEKLPNGHKSAQMYALTAGNGSRDVMVIKGAGNCLNLEELAAHESPVNTRPWVKFQNPAAKQRNSATLLSREVFGIPQGHFITICVSVLLALCWILLLITIPGLEGHTWFFIAVGGMGLFHNTVVAGMRRKPKERNLPLRFLDVIVTQKVMDGLMDLEVSYPGCGAPLLREFMPGQLLADEKDWWNEEPSNRGMTPYDIQRYRERYYRLRPRSMLLDSFNFGDQQSVASNQHNPDLTKLKSKLSTIPELTMSGPSATPDNPLHKRTQSSHEQGKTALQGRNTLQVPTTASVDGILTQDAASASNQEQDSVTKQPQAWDELSKPPFWD
ncbi:hypothetical protein BX600DRAFT_461921 [Xylariales sp. PMI_506]|nr:hypothetical protein BX600DRAFT_461921 [Xylariales sp. PMI_506]